MNYESFLIIYRDGNAELYRNGLPIARTDKGVTTLHQFKDAAGNPLPHTKDHLNALLELSSNVGNSAELLEAAALGMGLFPVGQTVLPPSPDALPDCGCYACIHARKEVVGGIPLQWTRMIVCETCGNKRCPHAENHIYRCTGSNEPHQVRIKDTE